MITNLLVGAEITRSDWFGGTLATDDYANAASRGDVTIGNYIRYRFNNLPTRTRKVYSVQGYWRRGYFVGGLTPGPDDASFSLYLEAVGTGTTTLVDVTVANDAVYTSGALTPPGGGTWTKEKVNDCACEFTAQKPSNIGGAVFQVGFAKLIVNHSVSSGILFWTILATLGNLSAVQPREVPLIAQALREGSALSPDPSDYAQISRVLRENPRRRYFLTSPRYSV